MITTIHLPAWGQVKPASTKAEFLFSIVHTENKVIIKRIDVYAARGESNYTPIIDSYWLISGYDATDINKYYNLEVLVKEVLPAYLATIIDNLTLRYLDNK